MRRAVSFLMGVVLGGLVGATLAILFAPESGMELRAEISTRSRNFADELRHAASSKRIELQERLESLRAPKA